MNGIIGTPNPYLLYGGVTASTNSSRFFYTVAQKGPKVAHRDPVPCPKCGKRAIADACGNDQILELEDHQKDADDEFETNGVKARIRVCASCSHLWATVVRPVEA